MRTQETATIRRAINCVSATALRFDRQSRTAEELREVLRMLRPLTVSAPIGVKAPSSAKPCYLCERAIDEAIGYWIIPAGRKYAAVPAHPKCATTAELERDRIWAELDADRGAVDFDRDKASTCECGHGFMAHRKDSLENYLECEYVDHTGEKSKPCGCDHFHYDHASIPTDDAIAAAAGR